MISRYIDPHLYACISARLVVKSLPWVCKYIPQTVYINETMHSAQVWKASDSNIDFFLFHHRVFFFL